ncbi:hypothetical protein [Paenibacillus odorifer]|uniref:hypothetical protein n=1 Tax=Paenibacillus odorifer TaxID=189426 RepID=UPI0020C097BC|nr:hypothetical protein [Paenibacillus odorifer]
MAELTWVGDAKPPQVIEGVKIFAGTGTMKKQTDFYVPVTLYDASFGRVAFSQADGVYNGYHDETTKYTVEEPNLQPENIPKGMIMFGIQGTMAPASIKSVRSTYFNIPAGTAISVKESALSKVEMIVVDDYFVSGIPHAVVCRRPGESFKALRVTGQANPLVVGTITLLDGNPTFTLTNNAGYSQNGYLVSYGT